MTKNKKKGIGYEMEYEQDIEKLGEFIKPCTSLISQRTDILFDEIVADY